jgi:hypothetical protein
MCLNLPLLSLAVNSKHHPGYFAKFGDYSYIDACEVQLGVSPSPFLPALVIFAAT